MNTRLISSYLFFINIYVSFYKKDYIYTFLFSNLLISSAILIWLQYDLIHLTEEIQIVKKIDEYIIYIIVVYGFYLFLYKNFKQKNNIFINGIIIYLFLFCAYLYYYGYYKNKYFFDSDDNKAKLYHSLVHLMSIIGHILILLI
jgi:hypothetical protein